MAKNDKILLDGIIDDRVASKFPSGKRDEAFEYLSFEQILKDFDLTKDEILGGAIDGRGDGGIDGFFIIINGHLLQDPESFVWPKIGSDLKVYIISCKHHDTFKQATIDAIIASLTELFDFATEDSELKGSYSTSLINMRRNLKYAYRKLSPRLATFELQVSYASRGDTSEIGAEVAARAEQIKSIAKEAFGQCKSEFIFYGSTELVGLHRIIPNYTIDLPFLEALSKGERYVLLARLEDYFGFITDNGKLRRYLFDSNVRDFMGLNRVNEDIKTTLKDVSSPDFWWLNNGVTILATSATVVGKSIQIADIQIVNGLQTTESLFRHFEAGGSDPENRCILVKVIVSKDEAVRDAIIRATNNQTDVEFASLHATDKIQRDIEDILRINNLYYERRKNFYVNLGHSTSEIVTPLYLASGCVSLIMKLPHKAPTLRSKFMRSPDSYAQVFSEETPIEVWPVIGHILKRVDTVLEELRPRSHGTEKFLKNWRHVISYILVSEQTGTFNFSPSDLVKIDLSKITNKRIDEIYNLVKSHAAPKTIAGGWTSAHHILILFSQLSRDLQIADYAAIEGRMKTFAVNFTPKKKNDFIPLTPEFVQRVKAAVPPQPWKPGQHRKLASELKCTISEYFAAVDILIDEGHFYHQVDGVLYDSDGNVVAFDEERVNPETLKLHNANGSTE